jgi:hypothetical protein
VARLQILQLPEGAGDDRPPYILVIDEAVTGPDGELLIKAADFIEAREATNARDVFIFEETVTIPANDVLPLPLLSVRGDQTAELITAHEQTRQALCDAFLLSLDTTWAQIVETAGERQRDLAGLLRRLDKPDAKLMEAVQRSLGITPDYGSTDLAEWLFIACRELDKSEASRAHLRRERDALKAALERVRNEPDEPEIMNAQEEHPTTWKHGYGCGVRAAKRAAATRPDEPTVTVDVSLTGAQRRDVQKIVNETIRETSRAIRMQGWRA